MITIMCLMCDCAAARSADICILASIVGLAVGTGLLGELSTVAVLWIGGGFLLALDGLVSLLGVAEHETNMLKTIIKLINRNSVFIDLLVVSKVAQ